MRVSETLHFPLPTTPPHTHLFLEDVCVCVWVRVCRNPQGACLRHSTFGAPPSFASGGRPTWNHADLPIPLGCIQVMTSTHNGTFWGQLYKGRVAIWETTMKRKRSPETTEGPNKRNKRCLFSIPPEVGARILSHLTCSGVTMFLCTTKDAKSWFRWRDMKHYITDKRCKEIQTLPIFRVFRPTPDLIVAGSLPLSFLMGHTFEPNDVDFWTTPEYFETHLLETVKSMPWKKRDIHYMRRLTPLSRGHQVYDVEVPKCRKTQVIIVHPEPGMSLVEYIQAYFDLSCCKCWYDGEQLAHASFDFTIVQRQMRVTPGVKALETYTRLTKYMQRGFVVVK